jgi:hypothetical protein
MSPQLLVPKGLLRGLIIVPLVHPAVSLMNGFYLLPAGTENEVLRSQTHRSMMARARGLSVLDALILLNDWNLVDAFGFLFTRPTSKMLTNLDARGRSPMCFQAASIRR